MWFFFFTLLSWFFFSTRFISLQCYRPFWCCLSEIQLHFSCTGKIPAFLWWVLGKTGVNTHPAISDACTDQWAENPGVGVEDVLAQGREKPCWVYASVCECVLVRNTRQEKRKITAINEYMIYSILTVYALILSFGKGELEKKWKLAHMLQSGLSGGGGGGGRGPECRRFINKFRMMKTNNKETLTMTCEHQENETNQIQSLNTRAH